MATSNDVGNRSPIMRAGTTSHGARKRNFETGPNPAEPACNARGTPFGQTCLECRASLSSMVSPHAVVNTAAVASRETASKLLATQRPPQGDVAAGDLARLRRDGKAAESHRRQRGDREAAEFYRRFHLHGEARRDAARHPDGQAPPAASSSSSSMSLHSSSLCVSSCLVLAILHVPPPRPLPLLLFLRALRKGLGLDVTPTRAGACLRSGERGAGRQQGSLLVFATLLQHRRAFGPPPRYLSPKEAHTPWDSKNKFRRVELCRLHRS